MNYEEGHPSLQSLHQSRYICNPVDYCASLPMEKVLKTKLMANSLLSQTSLRLKDLAKFIVLTVSHSQASRYAPLHYRSIQQSRIASLSSNLTWQDYIQLTGPAMRDLKCWFNCPPPPQTHHCLRT